MALKRGWYIIEPKSAANRVLNPSFEETGNYAATGSASISRVNTHQLFRQYALDVSIVAPNDGIVMTTDVHTNVPFNVYVHVYPVTLDGDLQVSLDGANYHTMSALYNVGDWTRYVAAIPAAQANGSTALYIRSNNGGDRFYLDGVHTSREGKTSDHVVYLDGDQPGCYWKSTPNASVSKPNPESRAWGFIRSLHDDYGFAIDSEVGTGMGEFDVGSAPWPALPGAAFVGTRQTERTFVLSGRISGSTFAELRQNRAALAAVLNPTAYAADEYGRPQPVRLWYVGEKTVVEIAAHYDGGLDMNAGARDGFTERLALRFRAIEEPNFREISNPEISFISTDTMAVANIVARIDGEWNALGAPTVASGEILNMAIDPVTKNLWVVGDFTDLDGIGADYIAYWDDTNWNAVSTPLNNVVRDILFLPGGTMFVCGDFTNAGGDTEASYIASSNDNGATWSNVRGGSRAGTVTSVNAMTLHDNYIYFAGKFTEWSGSSTANYVARLSLSYGYESVGDPREGSTIFGDLHDVEVDANGNVWVAGRFKKLAGLPQNVNVAYWTGVQWRDVSISEEWFDVYENAAVRLQPDARGGMYIGAVDRGRMGGTTEEGNFLTYFDPDTGLLNYVDGRPGAGPDDSVRALALYGSNIYLGGDFSLAARGEPDLQTYQMSNLGIYSSPNLWRQWGITLPETSIINAVLAVKNPNDFTGHNPNLYAAGKFSGDATIPYHGAGVITLEDDAANTYPTIRIKCTLGVAEIVSVENVSTGAVLNFNNLEIRYQETLRIILRPNSLECVTDYSDGTSRYVYPLENSDFGRWYLRRGANNISTLTAGTGTIEVSVEYSQVFLSVDGAD